MNEEMLRIPISGGELYTERAGSGPPVVFLHAGALDASMWDAQWDAFAVEHTVIRYDARSHGRSDTATVDFYPEDDLLELLDFLEIGSATLVGNSYGGATATAFALMYPDRVSSMVLVGPGITPMEFNDPFVKHYHQEQAEALENADPQRWIEAFLRYAVDGPHREPPNVDPKIREHCQESSMATVLAHHTATGTLAERATEAHLERISAPTRIIIGELDLPDLHRVANEAAARIPSAELRIMPGCGHMANMEQPELFNQLALEHRQARSAL